MLLVEQSTLLCDVRSATGLLSSSEGNTLSFRILASVNKTFLDPENFGFGAD